MKYVFIINSKAGRGKSKTLVPKIESACKKRNIDYEIRMHNYRALLYLLFGTFFIFISFIFNTIKTSLLLNGLSK